MTTSDRRQIAGSWSPDGAVLAFTETGGETGPDLMLYRPGADPEVEVLLATPFREWNPQISPDGRRLAYGSDASGGSEIYVRPMSGGGQQVKASTDGGVMAHWSPDGRGLIYRTPAGKMMAVSFVMEGDSFRPALPRELFDYASPPYSFRFDVDGAAGRILAYEDIVGDVSTRREPAVVVNWFEELEAKVPAPK